MRLTRVLASVLVVVFGAGVGFANSVRNSDYGIMNGSSPATLSVTNNSSATVVTADQIESASNPGQAGDILALSGNLDGLEVTFTVSDLTGSFPGFGELICDSGTSWGTVSGTQYCDVSADSQITAKLVGSDEVDFTLSGTFTNDLPLTLVITEQDPGSFGTPTIDIEPETSSVPEPASISLFVGGLIAVLGPKVRRLI